MRIIVLADDIGKQEFKVKKLPTDTEVIFVKEFSEIAKENSADAFFLLKNTIFKEDFTILQQKPVFINSVIYTLKELDLPGNFTRINGWQTFLQREIWEVASDNENIVNEIFSRLDWKYITVADEPGLISARIISMIINEAYFALGEGVSSKDEIDQAMKLGTNYPYGPFEWSEKIGLQNVYDLLQKLSADDSRHNAAPAMKRELNF